MQKITAASPKDSIKKLAGLSLLIGQCHDFGKYTSFFQDYILYDKQDGSGKHHHGLISALFAAYCVELSGLENNFQYATLVAYFTVLHHHGDLRALELDVIRPSELNQTNYISMDSSWRSRMIALEHQLKDIILHIETIEKEYNELSSGFKVNIPGFHIEWRRVFEKLYKSHYFLLNKEDNQKRLELFPTLLFLYSALIDSDKMEAAGVERNKRIEIPSSLVDQYREKDPKIDISETQGINGIRNQIYRNAVYNISSIPLNKHILTLTAPTGTGKTFTAFSCALKLRYRISGNGYTPRIIYALPFTSIIDQNFEVIKKVLNQIDDFAGNESLYLIKHHHLADLIYKKENEERPVDESLMFMESWESEIIVTTFVQLLHTIIGFKNRFLKKFHNIAGSIIILDEVQNIPVEYWPLVRNMLLLLCEHTGSYIILCTATKPLIFDEEETAPLLENPEQYFSQMNRVDLIPDLAEINVDDLVGKFISLYDPQKSYLVVLNTIKTTKRFYAALAEIDILKKVVDKEMLFYLSTDIVPKERQSRIYKIKDLLEKKEKVIVISTQLVEAGVDIDLDIVIRDIGPIDSVIQVAGRCNRGMAEKTGTVYVFHLTDGNNGYAKYVYGAKHYDVALKTLMEPQYNENKFHHLISRYFEEIKTAINMDDSADIWEAINHFRFYMPQNSPKSISDFRLIKDKYGYVDVFVETCWCAENIWKNYATHVLKEKNISKRRESYLALRSSFKRFTLSAPQKLTSGLEEYGDLMRLRKDQLGLYYDKITGFKRTEDDSLFF
jgi:CRISPR-associated endonuclease/helicase Cas3